MSENRKQFPFITYLEAHADDRAMLASLRRGLGQKAGEVAAMFPYIIPFIKGQNRWEENNFYLIASLFALHPLSTDTGNMGYHLRTMADGLGDDAATSRRFVQLLNQHRESLDAPIRQHVSLLKSHEIGVNWHQLLYDLNYWSHEDAFVQRQWASKYWG